jgi:hypothetical protein
MITYTYRKMFGDPNVLMLVMDNSAREDGLPLGGKLGINARAIRLKLGARVDDIRAIVRPKGLIRFEGQVSVQSPRRRDLR